jgi:hypothetical protein
MATSMTCHRLHSNLLPPASRTFISEKQY